MLTLKVKPQDYITVGNAKVYNHGKVTTKMSVEAPREVKVLRSKVKTRTEQDAPTPTDGLTDVYADADEVVKEQTI